VRWDTEKSARANIIANAAGGHWDTELLLSLPPKMLVECGLDLEAAEAARLLAGTVQIYADALNPVTIATQTNESAQPAGQVAPGEQAGAVGHSFDVASAPGAAQFPIRSPIRWFGGKGHMVSKLLRHVPPGGRPYCEPFMGAASLFFARDPAPVEVLNDLDGDLVNLFRCLQDPKTFPNLKHRIQHTLYSRAEFGRALEILKDKSVTDPVLRAWALFVSQNQSVGGISETIGRWGRVFTSSGGCAETTNRWMMRLSMLDDWHLRLLRVQIDNRDAIEVIRYWDNPDAVFYVDPPYHPDTRSEKRFYAVEPGHDYHERLVQVLLACKGAVVLSGYEHPVYKPLVEAGWSVVRYETVCSAAVRSRTSGLQGKGAATQKVPRVEVVWSNPRALTMMHLAGAPTITSEETDEEEVVLEPGDAVVGDAGA
jgi:DNA adenine methylase